MSLGINVVKTDVDRVFGAAALELNVLMDKVGELKVWLDTKSVADLEGMGYSTAEANTLKSAWADADQLRTLYEGTATLAVAKDFRTFLKLVYGFGL